VNRGQLAPQTVLAEPVTCGRQLEAIGSAEVLPETPSRPSGSYDAADSDHAP